MQFQPCLQDRHVLWKHFSSPGQHSEVVYKEERKREFLVHHILPTARSWEKKHHKILWNVRFHSETSHDQAIITCILSPDCVFSLPIKVPSYLSTANQRKAFRSKKANKLFLLLKSNSQILQISKGDPWLATLRAMPPDTVLPNLRRRVLLFSLVCTMALNFFFCS